MSITALWIKNVKKKKRSEVKMYVFDNFLTTLVLPLWPCRMEISDFSFYTIISYVNSENTQNYTPPIGFQILNQCICFTPLLHSMLSSQRVHMVSWAPFMNEWMDWWNAAHTVFFFPPILNLPVIHLHNVNMVLCNHSNVIFISLLVVTICITSLAYTT